MAPRSAVRSAPTRPPRSKPNRRRGGASRGASSRASGPCAASGWRCRSSPVPVLGILALMTVYYDEIFHVGEQGRGLIAPIDRRRPRRDPARWRARQPPAREEARSRDHLRGQPRRRSRDRLLVIATSPWLAVAIAASATSSFVLPILPPAAGDDRPCHPATRPRLLGRRRLFIAPGLLVPPLAGTIGDHVGLRWGILVMVGVFAIGSIILGSAGLSVEADIRRRRRPLGAAEPGRARRRSRQAARVPRRRRALRPGAGAVQRRLRRRRGRDRRPARHQRRRQVDAAARHRRVAPPSNGAIFFDGEDITFLPPDHVERGIVTVPGGKGVFPTLTVAENLRLAAWPYRDDPDHVRDATERVLTFFPRLRERSMSRPGNLSGGEQQMLTLGQAFIAKPEAADDRRVVARPGARGRRAAARDRARHPRPRHHDHPRRAVGQRRPHRRPPRRVHGEGRGPLLRARPPSCSSAPTSCARCSSPVPAPGPVCGSSASGRRGRPSQSRCSPSPASAAPSAASPRSTTSTSRCARARSSASSARTAPARPRCSTSSPASSRPTPARSRCSATTSPTWAPTSGPSSACSARSRTPACSPR